LDETGTDRIKVYIFKLFSKFQLRIDFEGVIFRLPEAVPFTEAGEVVGGLTPIPVANMKT